MDDKPTSLLAAQIAQAHATVSARYWPRGRRPLPGGGFMYDFDEIADQFEAEQEVIQRHREARARNG